MRKYKVLKKYPPYMEGDILEEFEPELFATRDKRDFFPIHGAVVTLNPDFFEDVTEGIILLHGAYYPVKYDGKWYLALYNKKLKHFLLPGKKVPFELDEFEMINPKYRTV